MTLGEKIQELRRRSGMSQDSLAEKLDVSRQAVSKWERDEAMPETDKIVRIAQVFSVTTDSLLVEQRPLQEQPIRPGRSQQRSWDQRLDRFVRRHGYKAGYGLILWGAVLCLIALLVMIFVPILADGFTNAGKIPQNAPNSGIYVEGDIPPDVLDELLGEFDYGVGAAPFTDMEDMYNQQVEQMNQMWNSGVRIISAMFGVPVLLLGIGLIVAGVVVIRKGKKLAQQTQ